MQLITKLPVLLVLFCLGVSATVTNPALPCTGCPKIYNSTCSGFTGNYNDWCAGACDVGIYYTQGKLFDFGDENTCSTTFACPLGTYSEYELFGASIPGPPLVVAYCQGDGPNAGKWYYGLPPLALPIQLKSLVCRGAQLGK